MKPTARTFERRDPLSGDIAAKARTLRAGNPRKEKGVVLGSLVDRRAAERVQELINDASTKGAVLAAGGQIDGTIVSATVVDKVNSGMRIYHEETFGPSVSIIRVKDTEEAIRIANDTEYGLAAAVFGRDISRALDVANELTLDQPTSTAQPCRTRRRSPSAE